MKIIQKSVYNLKRLIDGRVIGTSGWYAAVPEEGYKGHPFVIRHYKARFGPDGERNYTLLEVEVKDWNKAEAFRKQPQTLPGRSGWYTLGYFKIAESL